MTYNKNVPDKVFDRWKILNPNYIIDFSLDEDCINFLKENFNDYIVNLFKSIKRGMYKADLWRLCKLYINGGVYADVDLVPYVILDDLQNDVTFYSCMANGNKSIFQAFMVNNSPPRNPLILHFISSFIRNAAYNYGNGPTYDMYNCIKYNLNNTNFNTEQKYYIDEVKINVFIGNSKTNTKQINLHYFPDDIKYTIKLVMKNNLHKDEIEFKIENNILHCTRIGNTTDIGWDHSHSVDICIQTKECIYIFPENIGKNNNWITSYVTSNSRKILDSRDLEYNRNRGW